MESIFDPDLFISKDYQTITFSYQEISQSLFSLTSSTTDYDLTGQILWPAAEYLSKYIIDNPTIFKDQLVLELGSGVGLSGLISSIYAKKAYLTDGNDTVIELLEKNRVFAKKENVFVKKLLWGKENTLDLLKEIDDIDIVIGTDVLFWPDSIKPLVETLKTIKDKFPASLILFSICYRAKYPESVFDDLLKEAGLEKIVIMKEGSIFLYKIDRFS
jgi:predicted nicotinamide N-methyase